MKKNKKKQKNIINNNLDKYIVCWPTTILKLALLKPFRSKGTRFWDIGSQLFLCFSSIELSDEEGIYICKGWQISNEKNGKYIKINKETARRLVRGIILDLMMKSIDQKQYKLLNKEE